MTYQEKVVVSGKETTLENKNNLLTIGSEIATLETPDGSVMHQYRGKNSIRFTTSQGWNMTEYRNSSEMIAKEDMRTPDGSIQVDIFEAKSD